MDFIGYNYKRGSTIRLEVIYLFNDTKHIALFSKFSYSKKWTWVKTKISNADLTSGYAVFSKNTDYDGTPSYNELIETLEEQAYEILEHPAVEMALWFKEPDNI